MLLQLNLVNFHIVDARIFNCCNPVLSEDEVKKIDSVEPSFHAKEQLSKDCELKAEMRKLFFEPDKAEGGVSSKEDVLNKAKKYGEKKNWAKEVEFFNSDGLKVSGLFRSVDNAPVNIIYINGYFADQTPTKEWDAPFIALYPEFNFLSFDWVGFGGSQGKNSVLFGSDFGSNATSSIKAAISFIRSKNDKPIILMGFCLGAAMGMKATCEIYDKHKDNKCELEKNMPSALVLNSLFTTFEEQFDRAASAENRWYMRLLMQTPAPKLMLNWALNGSLFDLKPTSMIEKINEINIPCYFEHFTKDPFAIIDGGKELYQSLTVTKKMFFQSDVGRHVRLHTVVPYQVKTSFYNFLHYACLIEDSFFIDSFARD